MKLIIAIVQPEELPDIKEELLKRKIYKFTVSSAKGQGKEIPVQEALDALSDVNENQDILYDYVDQLADIHLF